MLTIRSLTIGAVLLAFLIAAVVVRLGRVVIQRTLRGLDIVGDANQQAIHARAQQLTRALTLLAYGVAVLASVALALSRFGLREPQWDPSDIGRWVATHGVNAVIIVIGAFVVVRVANLGIDQLQFKLSRRHASMDFEWQRRAATIAGILTRIVSVAVGFVAILMLLRELSIDIVPLLTGAGIAGLAIGFGAQNLVRDVISGFFLILEDQVRVGDLARINGVAGTVEHVNLRTIVLRDGEGAVQVFPNGTIATLANLSKQFSFAVVDVRVAYTENLDRVFGTIREVGTGLERDSYWSGLMLAPLEIVGVESIDGGAATVRIRVKAQPLNHGKLAKELRRRLLGAFIGRGIRPYVG
jgi:small conductance mechanosensitive channel